MSRPGKYDIIIVGAGIAGLCTAELFARAGYQVALLERNEHVCAESSGFHHEWFHFGSLYAIFPPNNFMKTLVGGIDDLLAYYQDFPGMNLEVDSDGKLQVVEKPGMWIRNSPIEYIVTARNDPDFSLAKFDDIGSYAKKLFFLLSWEFAIKQFISRHQRFHQFDWRSGQASEWVPRMGWWNYSRDVIFPVTELDATLDRNTHFRVPGFDRPMNSSAIIADLLRSFLHCGGKLRVCTGVKGIDSNEAGGAEVKLEDGTTIHGSKIIVASGRTLNEFLGGTNLKLKTVLSPLLVVYPAVSQQNFVRLTPFPKRTVNHLCHTADGKPYSLIGGGFYASIGDQEGLNRAHTDLITMAHSIFPQIEYAELVKPYAGYKVEMTVKLSERNYQYHVKEISRDVYAAVPGKFSLGFSLALDLFRKVTGKTPPKRAAVPELDVSNFIIPVRHKGIVLDHLARA